MAGGGQEARLRQIGFLGDRLRPGKFGVEALQFPGALVDPLLQQNIGRFERLLGLNGLGGVGIGRDHAPVGQAGGPHFDDPVARKQPQPRRVLLVEERGDALGDEIIRVARARKRRAMR